jgi:hypothetical protein
LRKAGGEEENDTVLEAFEEHGVAKDLMAKIGAIGRRRDETLKAKLTVLAESVRHHVEEEEHEIFDQARRTLGDERLTDLGAAMQTFKETGGRSTRGRRKTRTTSARTESRGTSRKKTGERAKRTKKSPAREARGKKSAGARGKAKRKR